jgi:hypothetical protein
MLRKKLTQNYKDIILVFLLSILSFLINYYYGFIGMMPMDNTVLFNGGYRVLKGYVPFSDYWLVTGPLLDYLNAFFFKILGISWSTFIIHSSLFNSILAVTSYYFFKKLGLSNIFSFIYSLLISILFYPVVGTPFVDHHSTFFIILAFYSLILAIKSNNSNYYILIPSILFLSFLSKQTPAAYGIIIISILILLVSFFYKNKRKEILKKSIYGSIISLIFLFIFFLCTKINLNDFIQQYIFFASSIGEGRLENYSFNIFNEIIKYKFIAYFIFLLIFIFIKLRIENLFNLDDSFILLTIFMLALLLIFHQMISLNQNFIFFIIPLLCGIVHTFYNKIFKLNYLLIATFIICIFSTGKYHLRFNEERKFNELENVDLSKAIDAKILDNTLQGLKWITYLNPNEPQIELNNLKEAMNIFKKESSNKMLITEYQIIAPILDIYDNSPNQWHHPSVSFPLEGNEYFNEYKKYFISKIKKKKIQSIFETRANDTTITELILNKKCLNKTRVGKMLIKVELNLNCEELK